MIDTFKSFAFKNIKTTLLHLVQEYKKAIGLCILFVLLIIGVSLLTLTRKEGRYKYIFPQLMPMVNKIFYAYNK